MVHVLKNYAIRLWISTAAGSLATLGLLAILGSPLEPSVNLAVAAILIILAFAGCGWIFNRLAALRVQDCLREAISRERTVRIGEAGEAFRKAVTVFDSFMVSPLLRRKMGPELAARIARFHIARAMRSPEADAFITSYLWTHPEDGEVAEYWLQHSRLGDSADPDHLALADRIAAAQPENLSIHSLIAQTYLTRRRTDYTALQIYKKLIQGSSHVQGPMTAELADLFLKEGRADEWALEVYLKAYTRDPDRTDYLEGLAACVEQVRESERNEPLFTASREILRKIDADTIRMWQASFREKAAPSAPRKPALVSRIPSSLFRLIRQSVTGLLRATETLASLVGAWTGSAGHHWRESPRTRQIAKWAAVLVFAVVVVVSGISTIKYIRETKEPPEAAAVPVKQAPQIAASGKYTVQAASFRNRSQAIGFENRLKQMGFPAYSGESRSSEDNIWYYVRISRFEDKQKAREFAEDLKSRGIIDDFYITSYTGPDRR